MLDCFVKQRRRLLPIRAEQNKFIEMEHDDFTLFLFYSVVEHGLECQEIRKLGHVDFIQVS